MIDSKTNKRYLILVAGMIMQLCAGILYMWSVFRGSVSEHLSWDMSSAALTSSFMLASFVIGLVIGGLVQDRIGPRPVAAVGSVFLGLGMILSAFVPPSHAWLIYITYGITGGLGVGFVYTTTVSAIQKWFPDKRGFATGMMVGSFGFSLVFFSPLANFLLESFGVSKTFLLFGISFLIICFACSMLLCNPYTKGTAISTDKKQYTTSEMLKTGKFYLLAFSMFFVLPAYFILNPLFISLGLERGLTSETALLGVMITGIASASGRLFASWFSDFAGRKTALLGIALITLIFSLLLTVAHGIFFLICIAVIAFAFGGSASVYSATAADLFGTKHIGLNYGCVMIGFGASALLFPIISNSLLKEWGVSGAFVLSALTCIISVILILFLKIPKKTK